MEQQLPNSTRNQWLPCTGGATGCSHWHRSLISISASKAALHTQGTKFPLHHSDANSLWETLPLLMQQAANDTIWAWQKGKNCADTCLWVEQLGTDVSGWKVANQRPVWGWGLGCEVGSKCPSIHCWFKLSSNPWTWKSIQLRQRVCQENLTFPSCSVTEQYYLFLAIRAVKQM